jgi:hypothetical protein
MSVINFFIIKHYSSLTQKIIVPLHNIVIKMNKGFLTDIVWDNGCFCDIPTEGTTNCFNKTTPNVNSTDISVTYAQVKL